jgi:type IV secretory pathway VirB2 component (pilin)
MAPSNQEIANAAQEIEQRLAPVNAAAAAPTPQELCKIYNGIKGPLGVILPVIKLIPVYGAAVAGGIQLLMGIADKLCPTV